MPLAPDQREALAAIESGESCFITGSAGSGKSHLMRTAISAMRDMHGPKAVYVTASSGIAAWALGGTTVHSFSGVRLGRGSLDSLIALASSRYPKERWIKCEVLFIDEVSMLDGALFEKLDGVARAIRGDSRPWGGIQLVLCGDFFQLPPVGIERPAVTFCFQTDSWAAAIANNVFCLVTKHRHGTDARFGAMLDKIRVGTVESDDMFDGAGSHIEALKARGIEPTHLYATNRDVDAENETKLAAITEEEEHEFEADDWGVTKSAREAITRTCLAPEILRLKVGAQVMLLKNIDTKAGLVNGARGVCIGFSETDGYPTVRFANKALVLAPMKWELKQGDAVQASRAQIPVKLAWALTIHKSQGMTLDSVCVDLSSCFAAGQGYVALSRARSLDTMEVRGFGKGKIKAHAQVKKFYRDLGSAPPPQRKRKRSVSDSESDLDV